MKTHEERVKFVRDSIRDMMKSGGYRLDRETVVFDIARIWEAEIIEARRQGAEEEY